tara:strand:+ start:362 stop:1093 length:732 start_codon:yes stop_codon:yes gene_type:complete
MKNKEEDKRFFKLTEDYRYKNGNGAEVKTMAEAVSLNDHVENILNTVEDNYDGGQIFQQVIENSPNKVPFITKAERLAADKQIAKVAKQQDSRGLFKKVVKADEARAKKRELKRKQPETLFQDIFDKDGLRRTPKTESRAAANRRTWQKVEANRSKGKADYEGFQDYEITIADSYANTKKLQKEITKNLNDYMKNKIPTLLNQESAPVPTPSFISNPQPESKGIADDRLIKDAKLRNEILYGK